MKTFTDRNLTNVNPLKEQFEPTEAQPIRQHARMAGGSVSVESPKSKKISAPYRSKK